MFLINGPAPVKRTVKLLEKRWRRPWYFERHRKLALAITSVLGVLLLIEVQPQYDPFHLKFPQADRKADHSITNVLTSVYDVNYMTEEEAMTRQPCEDPKLAADLNTSRVLLWGSNRNTYRLGDKVPVVIRLYNGYGTPLTSGGAVLRARMVNVAKKAYSTSPVSDHGNGTYTVVFDALWTGGATIKVQIAYTPEVIRAIYYIRLKLPGTRCIDGVFTVKNVSETTPCHPFVDVVRNGSSHVAVCNLTGDNSGMPWYCIKPRNIHLLCEDWTGVNIRQPNPKLPLTPCEAVLLDRAGKDIHNSISIDIEKSPTTDLNIAQQPFIACSKFNKTALWNWKQPTGFVFGGKWLLRHCKGHNETTTLSCLSNKKVLLFGDSTVRQWYVHILAKWACTPTSEKWTKEKWHKRAACANSKHNFTIQWLPHSQPFYGGDDNRYTTTSIARHLDETGSDEQVIVLLYLYVHMLGYHHSVFRIKIHKIRLSVERLISRNTNVKVFIKGPHTFNDPPAWRRRLSDFYVPVYKHILYEEFMGLHDKVVFLDHSDIADAVVLNNPHPPNFVVAAMVKQLLDYLC